MSRLHRSVLWLVAWCCWALVAIVAPAPAAADEHRGPVLAARGIEGDTLRVVLCEDCPEERVRLLGIDTPERGQPLADAATEHLAWLLTLGQLVLERCEEDGDHFGWLLRHVFVVPEDRTAYWLTGEHCWLGWRACSS